MESKKYNILVDRQRPGSEEIAQRRDFDALLSQYYAAPQAPAKPASGRKGWIIGAIAVAAVATTTIIWLNSGSSTVQPKLSSSVPQNTPAAHPAASAPSSVSASAPAVQNPETVAGNNTSNAAVANSSNASGNRNSAPLHPAVSPENTTSAEESSVYSFINAPLKQADIRRGVFHLQAQQGGEVKYATGSIVRIPANAFVDASGQPVTGEVEVRYREFHDVVDFFCSGIPMQYDSAGKHYDFVSAGMLDISAFKNGKEVFLKKGEKMNVEFASRTPDESFNLYRLNAETKQWVYIGRDKASPKASSATASAAELLTRECTSKLDSVTTAAHLSMPVAPRIADKKKNRFNVDIDTLDFPELKAYVKDGALFELSESQTSIPSNLYSITWEEAQLSKTKTEGLYKLQLRKGITRHTLYVYPVYREGSSAAVAAQANYDAEMKTYRAAKSQLDNQLQQIRNDYQPRIAAAGGHSAATGFTATVIRAFEISAFGIYNLDQPETYPAGAKINASLVKADGKMLGCKTFYLVDKNKNGLFSYNSNPAAEFSYNPSSDNMIWAVENDKLYLYNVTEFRSLARSGSVQIKMTRIDRAFKNADELRAYLQL